MNEPEQPKPKKFVRFDFPPGAGPDEIAKAIREAGYKLLAEKAKAEQEKRGDS